MSAFAEFTVTTNKDIYTPDEKAIIVGAIPEDAPDGYAVLVKVTGAGGDCASQNTLPAADNSFRARPISLEECGFGEFTVSAFYADQEATSRIIISNSSQAAAGSRLEFRTLQTVMLRALDVVNAEVRGLIEGGYVLPEEVADKYSEGVSEASLALEALEFSDTAEAKRHMILAIQDFRRVLGALSSENVTRFEQVASDSNSDIVGAYDRLERTYNKLRNVAEKNGVDKDDQFEEAARLLSDAKEMMAEDNYEGAERQLEQVNAILEQIREDLYEEEDMQRLVSDANSVSQADEGDAQKLYDTAMRYEKDALKLLNQTGSDAEALAKVQEALSLVANATANIEAQELDLARDALRAAHQAILDAKRLIADDDERDAGSNRGEGSEGDSSGSGNGNDEDKGSSNSGGSKGKDSDEDDP